MLHLTHNRLYSRFSHLLIGSTILVTARTARSDTDTKVTPAELRDFVLAGMKDARDRLVRGIVDCKGVEKGVGAKPSDLTVFYAFDFEDRSVRFDRTMGQFVLEKPDAPAEWKTVETKFARTSTQTVDWNSSASARFAVVGRPDAHPNMGPDPFDIRAIGIALPRDYRKGTSFDSLLNAWMKQKLDDAERESNGLCRISWTLGKSTLWQRTVWIDENRGFSPIRIEMRRQVKTGGDLDGMTQQQLVKQNGVIFQMFGFQFLSQLGMKSARKPKRVTVSTSRGNL